MCFGGGSDASGEMRKQQQEQERRISEGLARINAIYGGGKFTPYVEQTAFTPGTDYWTLSKEGAYVPFDPNQYRVALNAQQSMGLSRAAAEAREIENQQQRIAKLMQQGTLRLFQPGSEQQYEGFGPKFYNERQAAYEQYQLPILNRETEFAQKQLVSKLGNQGLLNSSVARGLGQSLQQEIGSKRSQIGMQGLGYAQDLQKQIEDNRAAVTQQLVSSANPQLASQQALESASRFSAPSMIAPVSNLFGNWMNMYLAKDLSNKFNEYQNQYQQRPGENLAQNPKPSTTVA